MSDSFIVMNNTAKGVSLIFDPPFTMEDHLGLAQHKRRRLVRSAIREVSIPSRKSLDLVLCTSFDSKHLEKNKDLQRFFKNGILQDMREIKNEVVEILKEKVEEAIEEPFVLEEEGQSLETSPEAEEESSEEFEQDEIKVVISNFKKRGRKSKKAKNSVSQSS